MAKIHLAGRIVGHISRDSTAIEARCTPYNRKRDVTIAKPKRKRGRPRKGEEREPKPELNLEKQIRQSAGKSLSELNMNPSWGAKKNSQGNTSYWKGYKLHLDVTDFGLPVTAIVTGANVHDSQLAIPMEKMTGKKIQFLYSLMDSAYFAESIDFFVRAIGHVPLIDPNKRRNQNLVGFDPAQQQRFKIRTSVERANANLKDWLLGPKVIVRGLKKVRYQLLCGVVCLAALKIIQYLILPEKAA
jgi:hypothetical protein